MSAKSFKNHLKILTANHQQKSIKLNEYKDEYILINFKKLKLEDKISDLILIY